MTNERITDRSLQIECETLAQDIFDEVMADAAPDEDAEFHRDTMTDRAHEAADGHQWVIYYHYAHQIAGGCNTDQGEQFLEDTGMPETPTYDGLAVIIAYGEMRARIENHLSELINDYEVASADLA